MVVESEVTAGAGGWSWSPPVLTTRADHRDGVAELLQAIDRHKDHLTQGPEFEQRRRARRRAELSDAVGEAIQVALAGLDVDGLLGDISDAVASGEVDPYTAAAGALASDDVVFRLSEALRRAADGR